MHLSFLDLAVRYCYTFSSKIESLIVSELFFFSMDNSRLWSH